MNVAVPKSSYPRLCQNIGYEFSNPKLLENALTHRSAAAENNERLEFLGDSILNFVIAEILFTQFPAAREGELSRLRASLVKGDTLADIGREMNLSDYVILGEGEMKSGGFRRASILADCVEAIIGAVFIEAGFEMAKVCVRKWYSERLQSVSLDENKKDPKTLLQEWLQAKKKKLPTYTLIETGGESHCQNFMVQCKTEACKEIATATGPNRRQAEKNAAEQMLSYLGVTP